MFRFTYKSSEHLRSFSQRRHDEAVVTAAWISFLGMKERNTGASDIEVLSNHNISVFDYNKVVPFNSLPSTYKSEKFRILQHLPTPTTPQRLTVLVFTKIK
jgi:hypothetical protein